MHRKLLAVLLQNVVFFGSGKKKLKLNLENCKLDSVDFIGCDLSGCTPPKAKDHSELEDK